VKSDDLEFRLSQYLDGSLTPAQAAEVERLVAGSGEARALLEQYQKLDAALKGMPLPEVRWEALAEHISSTVANQGMDGAVAGTIGIDGTTERTGQGSWEKQPVRKYAMPWVRSVALRWAIAASVLVATGLGIVAYRHGRHAPDSQFAIQPTLPPQKPVEIAVFVGPQVEAPAGKPTQDIEIGPPTSPVADAQSEWQWQSSQAIVTSSPRVVIASGAGTAQDTGVQSPY